MVKLNRFTMPVFAGNAAQTQTSVFGTMKTSPQYTTDVAASIGTTAYGNGWADAIEIGYAPYMEDMNTLQRAITYQISYNQQQGIPEWDSSTEYYIGSLAKLNTANGSQVYSSLIDNNVGNLVSDATKWKLVFDTENSYVTTNTAQTITGAKTFTHSIDTVWSNMTKGTAPASNTYNALLYGSDNNSKAMGMVELGYLTNKQTKMTIGAFNGNTTDSADDGVYLELFNDNGVGYAKCPTPTETTTTSGTQIATTGWVNSVGNNVIHKTGTETIIGEKTVQDHMLLFKTTATAYNETPTANQYAGYSWKDKNGAEISAFYSALYSSGLGIAGGLSGFNLTNKSGNSEIICLRYDSNGNFFTQAPASDVANSIVTTVNKSKAANGYFQLGNGLIIQWGKSTASSSSGNVTLPKAFSSTNYAVVINDVMATVPSSQGSNDNLVGWGVVSTRTTTSFTAFLCNYENSSWWKCGWEGRTFTWIAIGY